MDSAQGQLLEIIEWTDSRDTLSYRCPVDDKEIKRGAQLIVRESQFVQFVYLGQLILWAEWLCEDVLATIAHRHVVLTIPRLLRPLLRRQRELLTELGRAAAEATSELVRRGVSDHARPGIVVSIATAGDLLQWHPRMPHCAREWSVATAVASSEERQTLTPPRASSLPPRAFVRVGVPPGWPRDAPARAARGDRGSNSLSFIASLWILPDRSSRRHLPGCRLRSP